LVVKLKCSDARAFLSQIASRSVSMQIGQADLDSLSANGYLSVMQKEDYDRSFDEVSTLEQMFQEQQKERMEAGAAEAALFAEERKTHSILFHFQGKEEREAELESEESKKKITLKEEADVVEVDSKIKDLIQKKSMIDRMVPYDGRYLSLTGLGVLTLNDLNVRNYRVSDSEFSDFIAERLETFGELRSIAQRGGFYVSNLSAEFPNADSSELWSVSIGLGKLLGDPDQISQRFHLALDALQHFESTLENKMMAAEIMTSSRVSPYQSSSNADLQGLSETLASLEQKLKHDDDVPKQLSAGVAATMLFGRRFDGSYPTDNYAIYSRLTSSYESAAILSVVTIPSDQLVHKFQSFRMLFNALGYQMSEDSELASAFLAISEYGPDDVQTKMAIIISALRNYLEYPLVAAAILTSIPTLEANETLDLMEKAYTLLGSFAAGLQRSEVVSLAVRMIHGIKNELVRELDSTAKIANTPVQFTYAPSAIFFIRRVPVIIAHSSYHSTFSGIGGAHPAHGHGLGGFSG
jgi:hypothetical protein